MEPRRPELMAGTSGKTGAHNFTRLNDFMVLGALLRNFCAHL
jgi:hypothetical protein